MQIDAAGGLAITAVYNRPTGIPNLNNVGFALSGADACVGPCEARLLGRRQQRQRSRTPQGHDHLLTAPPAHAGTPGSDAPQPSRSTLSSHEAVAKHPRKSLT